MLQLCGFSASNYYNKVKLALLEKGLPFQEVLAWVGEVDLTASPMGKVPYLITEHGPISESTVILEYLEQRYPDSPLLPADAFAAAKVRELLRYMELHLELEARRLYPEAFFGMKVSDAAKAKVAEQLQKNIAAFAQLARFAPYVAGDSFTLADCAAATHLPLISRATQQIYGQDMLAHLPVQTYLKHLAQRPSVQQLNADRKTNTEQMMAHLAAKRGAG